MTKPQASKDDLSALIAGAETAIEHQAVSARPARRSQSGNRSVILMALALAGLAYSGNTLWQRFAAPSQADVARDLSLVVDQARAEIESARQQTGSLPAVMPNAALASVVQYQADSGQYQIVVNMMGVKVTLQKDGSKITELGVN